MYAIIAGCGRVGSQLALMLSGDGHDVVIIDRDQDAFRRLGPVFNGLTVSGLAFDERTLREAGAAKADAFAAVTELDNTNLMAAEVASTIFEIPRVISRLYHPDREITYQQLGVNYILGTKLVAQKFYERLTQPGLSVQGTLGHDTQVIEFPASDAVIGKRAGELTVPGEARVIGVRRGEQLMIADDLTALEADDGLIMICRRSKVEDLMGWRR